MGESWKLLLVILPLVLAGTALSLALRLRLLLWAARPLDGGLCLGGRPLLGENKTWRGPLIMLPVAAASAGLLSFVLLPAYLPTGFAFLAQPGPALLFGLLAGAGYSLGELPNSFFKRRLGIPAGERPTGAGGGLFYVLDQFDSVFGVALLAWLVYRPPLGVLAALVITGGLVHIVFDLFLYLFEVKKPRLQPTAQQSRAKEVVP